MNSLTDDAALSATQLPSATAVADYLKENPDFFEQHPDVLRELEILHSTGGAISLVERQVSALRDENRRTKERFDELVAHATSNQALIQRIHELALSLMEAAGPEAIFRTLAHRLTIDFKADQSRSFVFAEPSFIEASQVPEFVGVQSPIRNAFSDILDSMRPCCGPMSDEQSEALIDQGIPAGGSAALLPLSGSNWRGILIVRSDDATRFHVEMGTDFLAYLSDIVSLIIDPWVAKGA
ncbi:MAG: hypothetical protein ACI9BW_000339 [Gammaproteobacteria bacterium]|jgi:uncharacterized protein YigA (DUF484 family)